MLLLIFSLLFLLNFSCSGKEGGDEALLKKVALNYADIVLASYQDSLSEAKKLDQVVTEFLKAPDQAGLEKARKTWIESRRPYLQTEVFRFYAGPIDDEDGPEPFINAWPIDEVYIDYVKGNPQAGIISDTRAFPKLTEELILNANERGGETMISCGYHAIEFLLWGQDFYDDGPGRRPFSDYTSATNADRRGQYLAICCDLLVKHLESLVKAWAKDNKENYRQEFLADPKTAVWNIVSGIKHFSATELAGERLLVAWDTMSQEDEHSCFSDTTHLDLINDIQGMKNVYYGNYKNISGEGLDKVVGWLTPELSEKMDSLLKRSFQLAQTIPAPFDQAILGDRDTAPSRKLIINCVESLEDQGELWAKVERQLMQHIRSEKK